MSMLFSLTVKESSSHGHKEEQPIAPPKKKGVATDSLLLSLSPSLPPLQRDRVTTIDLREKEEKEEGSAEKPPTPHRQRLGKTSCPSLKAFSLDEAMHRTTHFKTYNPCVKIPHLIQKFGPKAVAKAIAQLDQQVSGPKDKPIISYPEHRIEEILATTDNPSVAKQLKVNLICSCLARCKIRTRADLLENLGRVIDEILTRDGVFKSKYSEKQCLEIFKSAIKTYNDVNAFKIPLQDDDVPLFNTSLESGRFKMAKATAAKDDVSHVTKGYDRLHKAYVEAAATSQRLSKIIEAKEFAVCPHVIIGTGDTGTTIWLEKYKACHGKTQESLEQGKLPEVLMIGDSFGCWKHDYTLAQPHNLLERCGQKANPSDYVPHAFYQTNPYANARHVYQANLANLARTDAPLLLGLQVLRVEKKCEHASDWKRPDQDYRLIIATSTGLKALYTNAVDICTGLGPAKNVIAGQVMEQTEFDRLNKFCPKKKFTPIVDGNQFILSDSEEKCSAPRAIVVYGGGGTAAACYRKGFYGHDKKTEPRKFQDSERKNKVFWIAGRNFNAAGKGNLATKALASSDLRKEQFIGELVKVEEDGKSGKLILHFKRPSLKSSKGFEIFPMECDQLVYAIGQEATELKKLCQEFEGELLLDMDKSGTPLRVMTKDGKVNFFGAAAMCIRQNDYSNATWDWLRKENVGPDVGPGSMPPSRAQIRLFTSSQLGIPVESVNVNIDNTQLIASFLGKCGIEGTKISAMITDILEARKHTTAGFKRNVLQGLLDTYDINDKVKILGHGHLVKK